MEFLSALFSRRGLALVCAAFLTACTAVVVDDPGPRPRPPRPEPQFCPRVYDPVCAERRGERQTFPNGCEADAAGYRIIRGGECRRGGTGGGFEEPRPPRPDRPRPRPEPEPGPRACTREYAPVCATRRGNVRTFGNACEARAASYSIIDPAGPC